MYNWRFDPDALEVQDDELINDADDPYAAKAGTRPPLSFSHRHDVNGSEPLPLCGGEVVAQKYFVDRVVGRKGLSIVALVHHVELGKNYVLNCLSPEHCVYPEVIARFLQGARAAQALESEHTVRIVDAGRLDSGVPYAVSEALSGILLRDALKVRGAFSVTEAVDYVLQACESIAEAHAHRMAHKNLSLSKLILTHRSDSSPFIKVSGFGIDDAVRTDPLVAETPRGSPGLNHKNAPFDESLATTAPEQLRGLHDIDDRADIWALGCILHETLSGAPVYNADSASALLAMIVADPPVSLRALRSDVPEGLESLVLHCLRKDPGARYPTLGELAAALKPFALPDARNTADRVIRTLGRRHQHSSQRAMVRVGPAASPAPPSTPPPLPRRLPPPARVQPRPSKALSLGLGVGGLVVGTLITLLATRVTAPAQLPSAIAGDTERMSLQREIVREIAALRAAGEASTNLPKPAESAALVVRHEPVKQVKVRPRPSERPGAPENTVRAESIDARRETTSAPSREAVARQVDSASTHDLFDSIH